MPVEEIKPGAKPSSQARAERKRKQQAGWSDAQKAESKAKEAARKRAKRRELAVASREIVSSTTKEDEEKDPKTALGRLAQGMVARCERLHKSDTRQHPAPAFSTCDKYVRAFLNLAKRYHDALGTPPPKESNHHTAHRWAVRQPQKVLAFIETMVGTSGETEGQLLGESTRNGYRQAAAEVLRSFPNRKGYATAAEVYATEAVRTQKEVIRPALAENELRETQLGKFTPWGEIASKVEGIKPAQWDSAGAAVCAIYVLFPPRRLDYGLMRVCAEGTLESREDRGRSNWLVTNADGLEFEFNVYKTAGIYKRQRFPVPEALRPRLEAFLVANKLTARDGLWLFGTGFGTRPRSDFCSFVWSAFHKVLGLDCTTTTLRRSYVQFIKQQNPSQTGLKEIAHKMGHSVRAQADYNVAGVASAGEE